MTKPLTVSMALAFLLLLPATGVCDWNRDARSARRELRVARIEAARAIHHAARETRRLLRESGREARYN